MILDYIRQKYRNLIAKNEDLVVISVALTIGIASGFGNVIFRSVISSIQEFFFGVKEEVLLYQLQSTPDWKIVLIPALGGLFVGIFTYVFKSNVHSVSDVIKSISLHRSLSPVTAVLKTISSAVTLGTGGSAGREGPIIMIGASIGSAVGQIFKFSHKRMSNATACGAAGGIAATFNAPMGGAMFAAEVLLGKYGANTFASLIIASVAATVVSRAWFGNELTLHAPEYTLHSFSELPIYALMGIIIAFIGVFFIRFFFKVHDFFGSLQIPVWIKPAIGGLLVGIIALFCRNIMGVGYGTIIEILSNKLTLEFLFILIILKILATSITLGSGGSGGQLVPCLFIGAAIGGLFGGIMNYIFPDIVLTPEAYALVGMGSMIAAVIRAPITSILILFEVTQSYHIVLPVMISCIISNFVANKIEKDSIFTWSLSRQGFKIDGGIEQSILESVKVKDVMITDILVFYETNTLAEIKKSIESRSYAYFPVIDDNGFLKGVISLNDIREQVLKGVDENNTFAKDFGTKTGLITITADESLANAMGSFGIKEIGDLPVVEYIGSDMKVIGLLRSCDIIVAYNKKMVDFEPNNK